LGIGGGFLGASLIEIISNIVNITGNPIADTIIFAIIGIISGSIAFGFVRMLFDAIGNHDSDTMSDVHWGVRVIIFALLTFIMVKIAQFFRWLFSPPTLFYFIAVIVLVIAFITVFLLIKKRKAQSIVENTKSNQIKKEQASAIGVPVQNNVSSLDICPFCGGLLIERKGPYGKFMGCTNFPKCKYTRKKY
jgi:H+/Cl- antiporter ClcA